MLIREKIELLWGKARSFFKSLSDAALRGFLPKLLYILFSRFSSILDDAVGAARE